MSLLTVEIHGVGTQNRGAELMAIAIAERLRASFPGIRLVVAPDFGVFEDRVRHGFWTTWEFSGRMRRRLHARLARHAPTALRRAVFGLGDWTQWLRYTSPSTRRNLGLVSPSEIDLELDASGFAFSDQWGPGGARQLADKMAGGNRRSKPLILLPQAFGPFQNAHVAYWTKQLVARASLVCARDEPSFKALRELCPNASLRRFPDFTLSVRPFADPAVQLPGRFTAIVPNKRMLDKGVSRAMYLEFLVRAVRGLVKRDMNPVFVIHDAHEDVQVVALLKHEGIDLPQIQHPDPRVLKEVLGKASFVIGSRFHALVSSLAQGVPCIGAGWSHKYPELFADFDCANLLMPDLTEHVRLESLLDYLTDGVSRRACVARIMAAAGRLKASAEAMWQEVEALIRATRPSSLPPVLVG